MYAQWLVHAGRLKRAASTTKSTQAGEGFVTMHSFWFWRLSSADNIATLSMNIEHRLHRLILPFRLGTGCATS